MNLVQARRKPTTAHMAPKYVSSRVASIDAARGAAMVFVCLAHFSNAYFFGAGEDAEGMYLVVIGMIASPTFVTMSGLVAGFLAMTRSESFDHLRLKLIDRGLFLLIVGHAILAFSGVFAGRGFAYALKIGYITDVVGFAVIVGPSLIASVRPKVRLILAVGVYALSWLVVFLWHPASGLALGIKQYAIGIPNLTDSTRGDFPLLPWFAVYLIGTVIGQHIGALYAVRREKSAHIFLAKLGAVSLAIGVAAKIALHVFRDFAPVVDRVHPLLMFSISSYQKFPPGPVYLLYFGGLGMLLVALILECGRRQMVPVLFNLLRQLGLASLFVYIAQFYVYVVVLRPLHLPFSHFWPLLFVSSLLILVAAAKVWNSREGNRYLTVGVVATAKWIRKRRSPALSTAIRFDASPS